MSEYGFTAYTKVGLLYAPNLWFGCAALNEIEAAFPFVAVCQSSEIPVIVSPTWKTPCSIDISINLGVTYLLTSWPSKNV